MSKEKQTSWKTYKRLLRYALVYKKRLFLGILFGMVSGGSIFALLIQLNSFMGNFQKGNEASESLVVIESVQGQKESFIVAAKKESDQSQVLLPSEGQILSSNPHVEKGRDELKIVPSSVENFIQDKFGFSFTNWLEGFFAKTLNMPLFDENGNARNALMILSVFGVILVMLLKTTSTYLNRVFMRWVGAKVVTDIRNEIYKKLMKQSMEFHGSVSIGDMMSRCSNDTGSIQAAVSNNISSLTRAPMEVLSVFIFIIYFSITNELYSFMAIMFIAMPLSILPVILLGKKLKKYANRTLGKISLVMNRIQETLSCMRVVKAYDMAEYENKEFNKINENHFKATMKALKYELMMTPLMEFVATIAICVLMLYSFSQNVPLTSILMLVAAANLAYGPMKEISKINSKMQKSLAAADRIFEYLDLKKEIPEKADAVEVKSFQNEISFEGVNFSYDGRQTLNQINVKINKGDFVAFVGEAGSGKSTLVNMLARFYDIHGGSIKIDGHDIRDLQTESIHNLIGYVDQRTILFDNTVRYNIAYGLDNPSESEILAAAEKADVMSFIKDKPEGLDFQVGPKGVKLSGGQCQRVAIARAMLKNPPILVLDEATSALDNVTEQIVQKAINELMGDRTVLAIAHRLSTVKDANCIYVLDQGNIIEQGTHEELLAKNGQYAKMWNIQFKD